MILNRVELRNFISHRNTAINFDLGVTAIVGPNGSGKTSILDAISYALFKVHSRGREEYVVNRGEREAMVRLSFTAGGRNYLVEWEVERGRRTRARLYEEVDGRRRLLAADGERTVVPEIERILEMDKDLFLQAVYVRQGEIEGLVAARPAERKKIMAKLLGIEDLEEAWENMREVIREHEDAVRRLELEVRRLEDVEAKLRSIDSEIAKAEREVEELKARVEEARVKADGLKALLDSMEGARSKDEELRAEEARLDKELALANTEVRKVEEELRRVEEAEGLLERSRGGYEEFQELTRRVEEAKVEVGRLSEVRRRIELEARRLSDLEAKLGDAERRLSDKLAKCSEVLGVEGLDVESITPAKWEALDRLMRAKASIEEARARSRAEADVIRGRLNEVERLIEELNQSPNACPVCGRPLSEEHRLRLLGQLKGELRGLKARSSELEAELARLEGEWSRVERLIVEVEQLDVEEVEELARQVEGLRAERANVEAELARLREEASKLEALAREVEGWERRLRELRGVYEAYLEAQGVLKAAPDKHALRQRLEARRAEAEAIKARLEEVRAERSRLSYSQAAHEKLKAEVEEAQRKAIELEKRLASRQAELENLRRLRGEWVREVEELRAKRRELEARRGFVELLERIRRAYSKDGLQRLVRARARPLIERYTREYLERFNLEYSDVKLDDDFNLTIVGPYGEQPIESISGGERVAIAIALRLAIARAIAGPRLELMMLDEPTIHLDEERRKELVEVLKKFFREGPRVLPQLILVTHDREIEEAADVVYVVTREAGYSKVRLEASYS